MLYVRESIMATHNHTFGFLDIKRERELLKVALCTVKALDCMHKFSNFNLKLTRTIIPNFRSRRVGSRLFAHSLFDS